MRSESDIISALSADRGINELVIVGSLIVTPPRTSDADPAALVIEDDELAADCRHYLLERGAPQFPDWPAFLASLKLDVTS
jgi:hypothetical protein